MRQTHKTLIFAAMVATTGYMAAQTALIHELQLPGAVTSTIVREYAAPVDIVYAETSQGNYFVHNDHSGAPVVREINSSLSVSDFAIDNDTVFFCGNDLSGHVFFGYFQINDFFFGTGDYSIDNGTIPTQSGTVASLSKMVTYLNVQRQIAAIGISTTGLPCVAHVIFSTPTSTDLEIREIPASYGESLLDIAKTDGGVVTAGFDNQGSTNFISLRYYESHQNLFFNYFNTVYYFTTQSNEYTLYPRQLVINKLALNHFSVATYYRYDKTPGSGGTYPTEYGTVIGDFISNKNASPIIQNAVAVKIPSYKLHGGWQLREITEAQSGSLDFFLLHDIETTDESGCHSTVYELSFTAMNTPSYIIAKYSTDCFLHSIDNHNTTQYSMSGSTLPGYGLAMATESTGAQTCLEPYSLQTVQIPLLPCPKEDPLGQPSTCQHNFSVLSANPVAESECTIKCKQ